MTRWLFAFRVRYDLALGPLSDRAYRRDNPERYEQGRFRQRAGAGKVPRLISGLYFVGIGLIGIGLFEVLVN